LWTRYGPEAQGIGERIGVDFEVAEQCLAHAVGDAVTRAYLRTSNVERRRAVMQRWAEFVAGKAADNVVELRRAGA
jgi:hypothetical protein